MEKLVRDHIPGIILAKAHLKDIPKVRIVKDKELVKFLKLKLVEEATELLNASCNEDNAEELADVLEVIIALKNNLLNLIGCVGQYSVSNIQEEKAKSKGTFKVGFVMDFPDEN